MPPKKKPAIVSETSMPEKPDEAALRLDADKFKFMFEHSRIAKSFTLPSGEMATVNQAFCDMLGYSLAELKDKHWQGITFPADLEISKSFNAALLSGEKDSARVIKRYLSKSGALVWADVSACVRRDQAGQPLYILAEIIDITARKQVEEDLKESAEKFRLLTEESVTGIFIIQDGKIAYINPSLARMFGFSTEELIGRPIPTDLIHPDDLQAAMSRLQHRLDGLDEKNSVTYKTFKKDGSIIHIEVYGMLIDYHGRPAVMGTLMDVTQRKQAEAALLQKIDELERFQRLTVGRELKMIEMKKEINALLVQSGQPEKYPLPGQL